MNSNNTKWWDLLMMVTIGLGVSWWLSSMIIPYFADRPEGTVETQEEWCEVGQVMSDGSVIYHGDPGKTELIAMATSEGPKLMGKCK